MAVCKVVIGVDVGETNTDAVIVEKTKTDLKVIAQAKTTTTSDVTTGVKNAVRLALFDCRKTVRKIAVQQINIGTTHFVNAVVEGERLAKVAVIRLCGTASVGLPPFSDFPGKLVDKVKGSTFLVNGGFQIDGSVITELVETEIEECLSKLHASGEKHVVVSGIFGPVRPDQELKVLELIKKRYPDMSVTMSHMIGQLGLLERENAAILNECIRPLCSETIQGFRKAFNDIGLNCPMYLTQNDGTIISEENAMQFPVHTFATGITNSMRGAAYLSGFKDAIVVDIGGTSTAVGILMKGFPREASSEVKVGGIRTNFRMPDVMRIGLGGGSYVTESVGGKNNVKVGPRSAGYKLDTEALVFASDANDSDRVITATDIAVAAGLADVGKLENVKDLDKTVVSKALCTIHNMINECIDNMRLKQRDLPLVLVGGGSILVDKSKTFKGVSEITTPEYFAVANAVGAAVSKLSTTHGQFVDERNVAIEGEAKPKYAKEDGNSVVNEPVTTKYIESVNVKTFGNLEVTSSDINDIFEIPDWTVDNIVENDVETRKQTTTIDDDNKFEIGGITFPEKPHIDQQTGEWLLSEYDIECLCIGSGIMGCGGGGNPHIGRLLTLKALAEGKKIRIATPSKFLKDADKDNDLIVTVAYLGATTVFYEKLVAGNETTGALQCMQDIYSIGKYHDKQLGVIDGVTIKSTEGLSFIENYEKLGNTSKTEIGEKKIVAVMSVEIGGMNCLEPLVVGAALDLPVLDCDGMGRAFPEVQMFSPFIYGCNPYPSTLAGDQGRRAVVLYTDGPKRLEDHFRAVATSMGGGSGVVLSHFNKDEILNYTVRHSMSHAWRLGDSVLKARAQNHSPVEAVVKLENARFIMSGTITDVLSETIGGFNKGKIYIEGIDEHRGKELLLEFQNEFTIAKLLTVDTDDVLACVPNLIAMMDCDTAHPIMIEEARYGMRVSVITMAAAPLMCTEQALKFVGPQAFGYPDDVVYKPATTFVDHPPVGPV